MTEPTEEPTVRVVDKRIRGEAPDAEPGEGSVGDASQPEADAPADAVAEGDARALEEARTQAASHLQDLQRLKAEFENFRKRMVREQSAMVERASQGVIERLLPVLDNFELALLAADRTKDYEAMVRGVEMVYGELIEVLRREGLERIDALDKPFDPEQHEAVMRAEGEGDATFVVDEMRPGYRIAGRVVRPAMVKVGPARSDEEAGDQS